MKPMIDRPSPVMMSQGVEQEPSEGGQVSELMLLGGKPCIHACSRRGGLKPSHSPLVLQKLAAFTIEGTSSFVELQDCTFRDFHGVSGLGFRYREHMTISAHPKKRLRRHILLSHR